MNEPLSPAAQRVRCAAICAGPELEGRIAAALRAAADQVVPQILTSEYLEDYDFGVWDTRRDVRNELFAIAAELEGSNG